MGRSGEFFHNGMAPVVLERYTKIPAGCTTEVSRVPCPDLFVCNDVATEGSEWYSVVVERAMEERPC